MLYFRSAVFNAAFYLNLIVQMIFWTPYFFLAPRKRAWLVPKIWARTSLWLQKTLAGTGHHISGLENLPEGSYILAPKHQSFWDTFAFLPHIPDAVYILKRELTWIPMFGWYVLKMQMIPVARGNRSKALKSAVDGARKRMPEGRQLIIYPEGTRRSPGAEPSYKYGIVQIYSELELPVVPIAHVAGLYWPRRRFLRFPGTIQVRILPPIEPGLDKETFKKRLIESTESGCDALLLEAARSNDPVPMPGTAKERLRQMGYHPDGSPLS